MIRFSKCSRSCRRSCGGTIRWDRGSRRKLLLLLVVVVIVVRATVRYTEIDTIGDYNNINFYFRVYSRSLSDIVHKKSSTINIMITPASMILTFNDHHPGKNSASVISHLRSMLATRIIEPIESHGISLLSTRSGLRPPSVTVKYNTISRFAIRLRRSSFDNLSNGVSVSEWWMIEI